MQDLTAIFGVQKKINELDKLIKLYANLARNSLEGSYQRLSYDNKLAMLEKELTQIKGIDQQVTK